MSQPLHHYRIHYQTGIRLDICAANPDEARRIGEREYPGNRIVDVKWINTRPKVKVKK